jgi:hypothetical protein
MLAPGVSLFALVEAGRTACGGDRQNPEAVLGAQAGLEQRRFEELPGSAGGSPALAGGTPPSRHACQAPQALSTGTRLVPGARPMGVVAQELRNSGRDAITGASRSLAVREPVAADQRTGHEHKREPPLRIPVPADGQPPIAAQPRQRPPHPPAMPPQLGEVLTECAWAAATAATPNLAAQFWRLARRIGKKKAAMAVGHSILVIAWHLLAYNCDYPRPWRRLLRATQHRSRPSSSRTAQRSLNA